MKKNISRLIFLVVTFFVNIDSSYAQYNDAALWENIYLEKKVSPRWLIHLNQEGRINQNMSRFYFAYGDFGVSYKVNKHIHFMADYVFVEKKRISELWSIRHQAYVAVIIKQKLGSFTFSDRIMPQLQYSDLYTSATGKIPEYYLREKATIKYNKNSRYTFYAAAEAYYFINKIYNGKHFIQGRQFDRTRYFTGTFYEINKANEVELYFLYEKNFHINNPPTNFVAGIGFAHTFY